MQRIEIQASSVDLLAQGSSLQAVQQLQPDAAGQMRTDFTHLGATQIDSSGMCRVDRFVFGERRPSNDQWTPRALSGHGRVEHKGGPCARAFDHRVDLRHAHRAARSALKIAWLNGHQRPDRCQNSKPAPTFTKCLLPDPMPTPPLTTQLLTRRAKVTPNAACPP